MYPPDTRMASLYRLIIFSGDNATGVPTVGFYVSPIMNVVFGLLS